MPFWKYLILFLFYRVTERVDKMEKNMALIAYKVNDVLTKLDQFEDSNRELSARIRSLSAN